MHDVELATRDLPVNETFAAYPDLNHPLLLSGCRLVEGFEGHLHSHGIEYRPRLHQLNVLLSGQTDWRQIADELNGSLYLFWGELEHRHYPRSLAPWRQQCTAVAPWRMGYDLYDLNPQPASVSDR